MNPHLNSDYVDRLAWKIERHGIGSIPAAVLRDLDFEANKAGLASALRDVLRDEQAPPVARQRAFGRIIAALAHRKPATTKLDPDQVTCAA